MARRKGDLPYKRKRAPAPRRTRTGRRPRETKADKLLREVLREPGPPSVVDEVTDAAIRDALLATRGVALDVGRVVADVAATFEREPPSPGVENLAPDGGPGVDKREAIARGFQERRLLDHAIEAAVAEGRARKGAKPFVDEALVRAFMEVRRAERTISAGPAWTVLTSGTAEALFAVLEKHGY